MSWSVVAKPSNTAMLIGIPASTEWENMPEREIDLLVQRVTHQSVETIQPIDAVMDAMQTPQPPHPVTEIVN